MDLTIALEAAGDSQAGIDAGDVVATTVAAGGTTIIASAITIMSQAEMAIRTSWKPVTGC